MLRLRLRVQRPPQLIVAAFRCRLLRVVVAPMALAFPRLDVPQERLLPKSIWVRPKLTGRRDSEETIHLAVGGAPSGWVGVEETLAHVASELCKDHATLSVPSHVAVLFGSIEPIANKLLAIRRLASMHLRPYWQVAAMRRNDIAHGKVAPVKISNSGYLSRRHPNQTDKSAGYMLAAPEHVTGRNKSEPEAKGPSWSNSDYRMSAKDIIIFAAAFHDLEAAIHRYIFFVQKEVESGLPRLILQLMADNPGTFGHARRQ